MSGRVPTLLLWAVLAAAFALRVAGIGFGLPDLLHQDEPIVVNHALAYASGDFHPHFFKIPPLASYCLFVVYGALYAFAALAGATREAFAVSFFRDPTAFYLAGRLVLGVLAGTASVWALYRLGERLFGSATGLAAAALLAVNFLHARDSHYIYADIPMIFTLLVSAGALAAYADCGRRGDAWRAAAWAGAAVAFKYTAAPLVLPLAFLVWKKHGYAEKGPAAALAACAAVTFGVYAALNPFSILDFGFFMKEILTQAGAEGSFPPSHHLGYSLFEGSGAVGTVLGIAGLALLCVRRAASRWVLVFPAAYFAFICAFSQPYERYALPLVPFLCLGAAYVVFEGLASPRRFVRPLAAALFALAAAEPLTKTFYLDSIARRPDTRRLASGWIRENLPEGTSIAFDHAFFSPKLRRTSEQIAEKRARVDANDPHAALKLRKLGWVEVASGGEKRYWLFYLREPGAGDSDFLWTAPLLEPTPEALKKERVEYLVRYRYPGEGSGLGPKDGNLVAVFSPYRDSAKKFSEDEWAWVALPFRSRELFSRVRPGPYLEIYQVNPERIVFSS